MEQVNTTVTCFSSFVDSQLCPYLHDRVKQFSAGQIKHHLRQWQNITSDQYILQMVAGDIIEFNGNPPTNNVCPNNHIANDSIAKVKTEIDSLLAKRVLVPCEHEQNEFISPIFIVPKPDNQVRLILNLKSLNANVSYYHFKMDSIHTVISMVTPNCWMASIDLKDAYYSVPIQSAYQNYLRFQFLGQLYQYTAFPNGLASCPRKFTKLLKPPLATLRERGHLVSSYIDDIYLQSETYAGCIQTVKATLKLFDNLGFVAHPTKSEFIPKQQIIFLGFVLNSVTMKITLTPKRYEKVLKFLQFIRDNASKVKIRNVARTLGYMVSSFPAIPFGGAHYRWLERDKIRALKASKGDFEKMTTLSSSAISNIEWWLKNLPNSYGNIEKASFDQTIYSDASLLGWGAATGHLTTGGKWSHRESQYHINALELLAAFFAIKSFKANILNKNVRLMLDNTAAVCIINRKGTTHNDTCNNIAAQIWEFCQENNILVTAYHIPGIENVTADRESRIFSNHDAEWMLNPKFLQQALHSLNFQPEIDLFASRLNAQFPNYCSMRPDPSASHIDAFSISWTGLKFYCFPPFSCVLHVLQKIRQDFALGVVVVPKWPTQIWYPHLLRLLVAQPVILRPSSKLLYLPEWPESVHPLHQKLTLMLCLLSGTDSRNMAYLPLPLT